jgi:hypothetical protein
MERNSDQAAHASIGLSTAIDGLPHRYPLDVRIEELSEHFIAALAFDFVDRKARGELSEKPTNSRDVLP